MCFGTAVSNDLTRAVHHNAQWKVDNGFTISYINNIPVGCMLSEATLSASSKSDGTQWFILQTCCKSGGSKTGSLSVLVCWIYTW